MAFLDLVEPGKVDQLQKFCMLRAGSGILDLDMP
jgi:hypothetical protein